jgi:hypothetical protein
MTPQEQRQLNDLLQEGIRLAQLLGDTASETSFRNFNGDLKTAQLAVKGLREEAKEFTSDISSAAVAFKNIVGEIRKTDIGLNQAGKSFSKLASIADKVQYHQREISKLSLKDVENLKKQSGQEAIKLKNAKNLLETKASSISQDIRNKNNEITNLLFINNKSLEQRKLLRDAIKDREKLNKELKLNSDTQNEISGTIEGNNTSYNTLVSTLDKINRELEEEQKLLGLSGAAVNGIGKALNKLGFGGLANQLGLDEAKERMKETAEEIRKAGGNTDSFSNKFKVFKSGISSMKSSLLTNLKDPLVVTGFLIDQMISALIKGDTATGDLAKEFNITYDAAADVRNELIEIGNLSGNIALNARALQESMVAVGKSLGSNAMLNQQDLETFTELREMAGYTNEELIGMEKITLATGGNLKDNTKQFLGTVSALNAQNKLTINEKQLLKEVSNTSAAIKLSVGGTAKGLAEAAFKAKEFGINLEQADRIAESLLDFESSITAELEAELLTGKDLNLERARLLALNGDIAGASAEILKQVKGSAEFTKMNRIQQEALAKAVGMSREDLAASLVEREALQNIGVKDAAAAKAKFDLLVKEKGYAAAVAELGDEQYANQLKQQSIQERFNKSVEKLQEIFISLAEPILQILDPIMEIVGALMPLVNLILVPGLALFKAIGKAISSGIKEPIEAVKSVFDGILDILSGDFENGFNKIGQGILRAFLSPFQAITEYFSSMVNSVIGWANKIPGIKLSPFETPNLTKMALSDGMIAPDGSLVVSGPKGTYSLDKNDSVIAGTNLNKPTDRSTATQSEIDLSPLLAEIKALRQEQTKSNTKPTIIENSVNGTRFGTAVAMNTYKTQ